MAVGTPAVVGIAQPLALGGGRVEGLHHVQAHLPGPGHLLLVEKHLGGGGNLSGHVHVHNLEAVGEGGGLHALQGHGLPGAGGAAHGDERTHPVPGCDGADLGQEGRLIGQVAVHELQKQGSFNHINLLNTIGHDCILDDFITIYPGCNISGNVRISSHSEIGTGTKIIQGMNITSETIIGAGSVVVKDIGLSGTYVGVPVKKIYHQERK